MQPQRLLLDMLSKYLDPRNRRMQVLWGMKPTLLLGGVAQLFDADQTPKDYNMAITRYAWTAPSDSQYDIHLFNDTNARRFVVYPGTIYTAQSLGRLSTDKLIREAQPHVATHLTQFLHLTHFSEEATIAVRDRLAEWDVVDRRSEIDTLYPDIGVYHYTEILKQEQQIRSDE